MFGIVFEGNRDLRRIYMPPGYESFPLRKDFYLADDASRSVAEGVRHLERTTRRRRPPGHARAPGEGDAVSEPTAGEPSVTIGEGGPATRIPSLDDPRVFVDTPATIYDAVPPYPPRSEREAEFYTLRDGEMLVNIGPQHPVHPRRPAPRRQDQRRAGRGRRPRPRLPPPRHREARGERRLPPGDLLHRPARVRLARSSTSWPRSWPSRSSSTWRCRAVRSTSGCSSAS